MEEQQSFFYLTFTENHGAHSGIHSDSSEYHDGGRLTHYFGNDEYPRTRFDSDGNPSQVGQIAYGNQKEKQTEEPTI